MTEKQAPPLKPTIYDEWGREYVPREPAPNFRNVPLHVGDLLTLRASYSENALRRMLNGENEAAQEDNWRSAEFFRIAIEMSPVVAEVDREHRARFGLPPENEHG